MKNILVVPACGKGKGGGHLVRSAALVRSIRSAGGAAWLFLPEPVPRDLEAGLLTGERAGALVIPGGELKQKSWSLLVLDRFQTTPEELDRYSVLAPVLGIDEGGCRDRFDFLLDLLPGLPERPPPNLAVPGFLPLPSRRRPSFTALSGPARPGPDRSDGTAVLVSFGAEDAAGLTLPAALALARDGRKVTAVLGPLRADNEAGRETLAAAGITVLLGKTIPGGNLRERLADYDLIVTHFGLTAFEALHARVPALLLSPTGYHEKLALHGGFVSAGTGPVAASRLVDMEPARIAALSEAAARRWGLEGEPRSLARELLSWEPEVFRSCPFCGAGPGKIPPVRYPGRTYRFCSCGNILQGRLQKLPVEYNRDYFFDDYKKQYGKTYLEDFPQLKKAAKQRLARILALLAPDEPDPALGAGPGPAAGGPPRLLDIGCAYGPFLAAAKEGGFAPQGLDPAEDAVRYVRETLGIPASRGFFPEALPAGSQFDVITLWYVIEHFRNPGKALEAVSRILKPGGVLAFSTPSAAGISRRKSPETFLEQSPADHWTVWDPRSCASILSRFGFTLRKLVITGHHPERFPLPGFLRRFPGVLLWISRIFGWGDTFEAYAVKGDGHG